MAVFEEHHPLDHFEECGKLRRTLGRAGYRLI